MAKKALVLGEKSSNSRLLLTRSSLGVKQIYHHVCCFFGTVSDKFLSTVSSWLIVSSLHLISFFNVSTCSVQFRLDFVTNFSHFSLKVFNFFSNKCYMSRCNLESISFFIFISIFLDSSIDFLVVISFTNSLLIYL